MDRARSARTLTNDRLRHCDAPRSLTEAAILEEAVRQHDAEASYLPLRSVCIVKAINDASIELTQTIVLCHELFEPLEE